MKQAEPQDPRWLLPAAVFLAILTIIGALSVPRFVGESQEAAFTEAIQKVGGDPKKGLTAMKRYGCAACHIVPGLKGPRGHVGPSLAGFANLEYIGKSGTVPNTPENVINWIVYPAAVDPAATMPSVGATESAARDMATYLYALR